MGYQANENIRCPTLRRLLDKELELLKETMNIEHGPLVDEWNKVLTKIRELYDGDLDEPEWYNNGLEKYYTKIRD